MPNSVEKWIVNGSLPILLVFLLFGVLTEPSYTGRVTSDNSYKSPTSDGSYKSPTTGPGYVAPKIDESWEAPKTGPGYIAPKIDESWEAPKEGPGFIKPEVGPGFVRHDEFDFKGANQTIDKPKRNETDKKLPRGPIDEKYVGGWRPYQLAHYYKKGGNKFVPTPTDLALNLHKDGTWTWGVNEGTWEVAEISDEDWKKWGITGSFQKKIVFHGWPYGGATTVDGPVEEIPAYVDYLWAVYDVEPPEAEEPAQAWMRFAPGPYTPKEEAVFSELSLIGKWGIHDQGVVYGGRKGGNEPPNVIYEWDVKFETTTILELKEDKTWIWGDSHGTWKVLPIEEEDWKFWNLDPYGPTKKLALEGWHNDVEDEKYRNIGSGPIEASSGQVDFFWVVFAVKNEGEAEPRRHHKKFRPYESEVAYLTVQLTGSGNVLTDDNTVSCRDTTGSAASKQCTAESAVNREFELKAVPNKGWAFSGWKGACEGNNAVCRVTMDRSKTVTAEFVPGCNDDSACALDQKCENSICTPLQCGCGYAKEHQCEKYECCSDDECGEDRACNIELHRCIEKSECKEVLINGDPAEKLDLVFVGYGFRDYETLKKGIMLLMDYKSTTPISVFSVSPFKENKDKFNVWMVMANDYVHNEVPSGYNDILLNVPEADYYGRYVKSCDRDTVVVLSTELFRPFATFPTSGASGGVVYMSLKNPMKGEEFFGRTLAHELGHAIGGLADEYVEYDAPDLTTKYNLPNCASDMEDAQNKWGDLVGIRGVGYITGIEGVPGTEYYKHPVPSFPELGFFPDGSDWSDGGCARVHKNIRPTTDSLMKDHYTFDNDFGPVNERALSKRLDVFTSKTKGQNEHTIEPQGVRGRRFVEDAG